MKILHIGLASSYTEGMTYQDNFLSEMNIKAGHEVFFVTDTHKYENGVLIETNEIDEILSNGLRLIRYKYDTIVNKFITRKIQKARKVKKLLEEFKPDAIMYHGVCGYELIDVSDYVKKIQIHCSM